MRLCMLWKWRLLSDDMSWMCDIDCFSSPTKKTSRKLCHTNKHKQQETRLQPSIARTKPKFAQLLTYNSHSNVTSLTLVFTTVVSGCKWRHAIAVLDLVNQTYTTTFFFQCRYILMIHSNSSDTGNIFKNLMHISIIIGCWDIHWGVPILSKRVHTALDIWACHEAAW